MLWFLVVAGLLLCLGDILVIAAAGTFKRGLDWADFAALLGPWGAMGLIVGFVVTLPWPVALLLSVLVGVLTIWGAIVLVKVAAKKRTQW